MPGHGGLFDLVYRLRIFSENKGSQTTQHRQGRSSLKEQVLTGPASYILKVLAFKVSWKFLMLRYFYNRTPETFLSNVSGFLQRPTSSYFEDLQCRPCTHHSTKRSRTWWNFPLRNIRSFWSMVLYNLEQWNTPPTHQHPRCFTAPNCTIPSYSISNHNQSGTQVQLVYSFIQQYWRVESASIILFIS